MSGVLPSIPVLDLGPEVEEVWDELNAAFQRVLRSGQFILGSEVEAFEREAADYLGVAHAVGVNSGTDALVIGLRALGVGAGDEVITTSFSFFATGESISNVGAKPVFVDIDARTFTIDPALIEDAVTERTRAIMPVHLYGRPCAMDAIMEIASQHRLRVVEDCAQAFGALFDGTRTGAIGDVGAYSFFPTKNLGGFGDGGLIATDDDHVAEVARMLRAHGARRKYRNEMLGYNSRLDALQAALLRVKLPHVESWNALRVAAARRYAAALGGIEGVVVPEVVPGHVFHQYTVLLTDSDRDAVQASLQREGIGTMVYYPVPQHLLPVYSSLTSVLPVTTAIAGQVLSLPIWPSIGHATQLRAAGALASAARAGIGRDDPWPA
jgi:dTDP-4-amino-4,6-dideoxygalactose transaminase